MHLTDRNVFVGALYSRYHPPSSIYETTALLNYIEAWIDTITQTFPTATVDLSTLSEVELVVQPCLESIVNHPTR